MVAKQDRRRAPRLPAGRETGWGVRLVALALILLVVMLGRSVWLVYGKYLESKTARDEVAAAAGALQERKIDLEGQVERLATPRGQEAEIRQKLPVAKEGEQVVVIIDESADDETEIGATKSWWQNLWPF